MINSKVIDIIKTFSPEEIKRFRDFLGSPFHNKNKKAVQLFEILSGYYPDLENPDLTKEKIFDKIFCKENTENKFNDASVRNLLSDLIVLTEKFLSYIRFEKDVFEFNEKCLRELIDRKLISIIEKKINQSEQILKESLIEGETSFYNLYILEELKSFSNQFSDNLKLYKDESIEKASDYLSYFYFIRIFKMVNFFRFQKMYNIDRGKGFAGLSLSEIDFEEIIKRVSDKSDKHFLIFLVYYKMYKTLTDPLNDKFYFEFKKSLTENDSLFSILEKYGLYVCLTNSCVQKIDMDKEEFSRECFEVYLIMVEKKLFTAYPGYFPLAAFMAILHTGIAAGEINKAEEVLNEFIEKLNPEHLEDARNYFGAQIYFHRKDFQRSLELISKTDTDFSPFKFHLKVLSLKIYYETADYESLYYTSDSFQHFLGKNKIVKENYKSEFNNFIRILDLLVKYKSVKDKKLLLKIGESLGNKSIAGRKWLIEKFSELKGKVK